MVRNPLSVLSEVKNNQKHVQALGNKFEQVAAESRWNGRRNSENGRIRKHVMMERT